MNEMICPAFSRPTPQGVEGRPSRRSGGETPGAPGMFVTPRGLEAPTGAPVEASPRPTTAEHVPAASREPAPLRALAVSLGGAHLARWCAASAVTIVLMAFFAEPMPASAAEAPPHLLIGKRWTAGAGIPPAADDRRGVRALGEVHDNSAHHTLRAAELDRSTGAVVFEQLRTDQQPAIDAFMALPKEQRTLDAFLEAVDWRNSGWAKYDYKPLFEAVIRAELPIYAGDPPKALIRKAAKEGPAAIPPEEQTRLGLDVPLAPELQDASVTEIEASHCGAMPKTAFEGMAFAQRLRDATIADVALKALEKHGAVTVFAGNGHVRSDRGVPWYVRRRAGGVPVSATMLVEVEDGMTDPEAYVPRGPDHRPAADAIVFTARAAREDPCLAFRKAGPQAAPPDGPITKN